MKKTLLTISLLFVWLLAWQPASANGGTSCGTATVATQGINHCDHTGVVDQWFTYTATSDCIITIASCGLTTSATTVNLIYSCGNPYTIMAGSQCGTTPPYQSNLVYRVSSGETLLIRWNSLGAEASYDWSLTEAPLPAGCTAETAIAAKEGINNTNHYGSMFDQWYTFTPNVDGEMSITNAATLPSTQNYFTLYTYDGSNFTTIASSNYYGEGSSFLTAGTTYYIKWNNNSNTDLHSWRLTFTPRSVIPGETCSSPITAIAGLNSASNVNGNQWFTYTPSANGMVTISTCGLTQEDTYVEIYEDCASDYIADNDDYCELQTTVDFPVVQGHSYLIKWKNDYTSGTFNWNLSLRPYKTGTDITSFEFPYLTLSSVINATDHTVTVEVGKNQDVSMIYPIFTLSDGAVASIGGVVQESGINSMNNFTSPVVYTVTAEDGVTTTDWTVTVTNASAENTGNDILTYSIEEPTDSTIFDAPNHAITVYVPFNQDITNLTADFTLSAYATATVGGVDQGIGGYSNDYTTPLTYTITAEDGTAQDWVVTVVQNPMVHGETCDDPTVAVEGENHANNAFPDQYFIYTPTEDGNIGLSYCGSSNKYYQIYTDCSTQIGENTMVCGNEDTYAVQAGVPVIIYWQNIQGDSWHLTKYPASSEKVLYYWWTSQMISDAVIDSTDHTVNITVGPNTDVSSLQTEFYLSTGATAYIGATQLFYNDNVDYTNPVTITIMAQDGSTQDWMVTVSPRALGTGNSIIQFTVNNQVGDAVIDEANHTVKVGVVAGTNVTTLNPKFQLSDFATAYLSGVPQYSGQNWVDFTTPAHYVIQSEEGYPVDWYVTVSEGAVLNTFADITSYRLDEQTTQPTIDQANKAIAVYVAKGTDRSALVPTFYLSTGAAAEVGTTAQVNGVTANDFTAPVVYSVTSQDGLTTNSWTVTVKNTETAITAFTQAGQASSTVDATNKTIAVEMPYGATVTDLVANYTLSDGATAMVGTVDQVSGATANDFTTPVVYTVTSQDGMFTDSWTVTVTVAKNTETAITAFSLAGQSSSTVDAANKTIAVEMPAGADATGLVATFALSDGATAKVGTVDQVSGQTSNDFTNPVIYDVTAEDGVTTQSWTVTVTVAKNTEAAITAFSLAGQSSSTVDAANKTIAVEMPAGVDATGLVATFALSDGATAMVGTVDQVSGTTANNFTTPVVYTVTAEDGTTTEEWTVTVTVLSGIEDNTLATGAKVYPNPSTGLFLVTLNTPASGTIQMDVFTLSGAKVLSKTVDGNKENLNVDLSGYQAGVYYLRMTMNGRTITLKLLRN